MRSMDETVFWILAAAAAVIVTVALFVALARGRRAAGEPAVDIAVYKDQLRSIDRDVARGIVTEDEADRLRLEIKRRILEADRASPAATVQAAPRGATLVAGALAGLVIIGGSLMGYRYLGAPGYGDLPLERRLALAASARANRPGQDQAEANAPKVPSPEPSPEFMTLMERLRTAVAERPEDVQGLELLAQNEARLGNFSAAWRAQQQILDLKGATATADDFAAQADLMVLAAGGYVSPEAEAVLEQSLRRDGTHPTARFYAGLLNAQTGRPDTAFQIWEPLLRESPPSAPWVPVIRERLPELAMRAGIDYSPPELRGPTADDMAAAQDMAPEDRAAMIENMVGGLATRLSEQGGTPEEWAQLIRALGVLGRQDEAAEIWAEAQAVFPDPSQQAPIRAAADSAGVLQ